MEARFPTASPGDRVPCPQCGYDLRAHPDTARCPECGRTVQISAAFAQANRWVDLRLLDLWSIFVLLSVGLLCLVVSLAAIGSGQYVALLLALGAGLYLLTATRWLLAIDFTLCTRRARRHLRMIAPTRRRKLLAWLTLDAALFILAWFVLIRARAV